MSSSVTITGAATGLGFAIANNLIARGRPVVLLDRDADAVATASSAISDRYEKHVPFVVADLSSVEGVRAAADTLTAKGDVGALVNNAGGWLPGGQFPEAGASTWMSAITLNLIAPMLLTQLLWPSLAAVGGAVVNIGSSGGVGDDAYGSPEYGSAKAGIRRFTTSLASRTDVRVMAVVPGWIGLGRAHEQWAALSLEQQSAMGPLIPPEDIAIAVATLLDHGGPGEVMEILRKGEQRSSSRLPPWS